MARTSWLLTGIILQRLSIFPAEPIWSLSSYACNQPLTSETSTLIRRCISRFSSQKRSRSSREPLLRRRRRLRPAGSKWLQLLHRFVERVDPLPAQVHLVPFQHHQFATPCFSYENTSPCQNFVCHHAIGLKPSQEERGHSGGSAYHSTPANPAFGPGGRESTRDT